jgi:hypothetical protein
MAPAMVTGVMFTGTADEIGVLLVGLPIFGIGKLNVFVVGHAGKRCPVQPNRIALLTGWLTYYDECFRKKASTRRVVPPGPQCAFRSPWTSFSSTMA